MKDDPKYKVGEIKLVSHWGGFSLPLKIVEIKWVYHPRLDDHTWGYLMDGYTGLNMEYVPEGYLRDVESTTPGRVKNE